MVHGLPQLRRLALGDVRQRHPAVRALPRRRGAGRRLAADPGRHPRRGQGADRRRRPDHRRHGHAEGARRDDRGVGRITSSSAPARRHRQPARGRVRAVARRRRVRCSSRPATTRPSIPEGSTSSSSSAAETGMSRCACTSAARGRPGPAAPAPCAVMVAAAVADGVSPRQRRGLPGRRPGGTLTVTWTADDRVLLTGPAVVVARGDDRPLSTRRRHYAPQPWTSAEQARSSPAAPRASARRGQAARRQGCGRRGRRPAGRQGRGARRGDRRRVRPGRRHRRPTRSPRPSTPPPRSPRCARVVNSRRHRLGPAHHRPGRADRVRPRPRRVHQGRSRST